jgi:hypothetical protein
MEAFPMQVHTFRGPGRVFGFTTDEAGTNLPEKYAPWSAFKVIDMHRDEPQAGVDVNQCLSDIMAHGFHLTDGHVRITEM